MFFTNSQSLITLRFIKFLVSQILTKSTKTDKLKSQRLSDSGLSQCYHCSVFEPRSRFLGGILGFSVCLIGNRQNLGFFLKLAKFFHFDGVLKNLGSILL